MADVKGKYNISNKRHDLVDVIDDDEVEYEELVIEDDEEKSTMKGKTNWEERYPLKRMKDLNEFEKQNASFLKEMIRKNNNNKNGKCKHVNDGNSQVDHMKYFREKGDEWLDSHCCICKQHRSKKGKLFQCSRCKGKRKYCSVACQRKDWKTHKNNCKK